MNCFFKGLCCLFLTCLPFLLAAPFCRKQTKSFTVEKISYPLSKEARWEPQSKEELSQVRSYLQGPFHYLNKGRFCYSFVSEDQRVVLKFLRKKKIHPSFWSRCPLSFGQKDIRKKEKAKKSLFMGYQMAYQKLAMQTQVLYLHLGKTSQIDRPIVIYDPLGIQHVLDADSIEFIVQKRADPFCPYFDKLLQKSEEEARELLRQFACFLQERAYLDICDYDLAPTSNIGILEGRLVTFDLSSLKNVKQFDPKRQMMRDAKEMIGWVNSRSPTLALFLQEELEQKANDVIKNKNLDK